MTCKHENGVAMENPRIVDESYEDYVIIEYDEICVDCEEVLDTEQHKFKWHSVW